MTSKLLRTKCSYSTAQLVSSVYTSSDRSQIKFMRATSYSIKTFGSFKLANLDQIHLCDKTYNDTCKEYTRSNIRPSWMKNRQSNYSKLYVSRFFIVVGCKIIQLLRGKFIGLLVPFMIHKLRFLKFFDFEQPSLDQPTEGQSKSHNNPKIIIFRARHKPRFAKKGENNSSPVAKINQREYVLVFFNLFHRNTSSTSLSIAYFLNFPKFTPLVLPISRS